MTGAVAAVDLGATSGRVMIGRVSQREDGARMLALEAVARFPNGPVEAEGALHWDFSALYRHVVAGLRDAVAAEPALASIGIDSWAVDYGLVQSDAVIGEPFHYRDDRTAAGVERVHQRVPFAELYARNGLQFLPFNTLYQYAVEANLQEADLALLIPDLVAYLLTGAAVAERTNASTTGLVDPASGTWDTELIEQLGLPASVFPTLVSPGTALGTLRGSALDAVGAPLEVITVGSHDTASAVAAVPLSSPNAAYISCGTWGLVGVETADPILSDDARDAGFTNEGGVDGRTRFLHNVTGLWLLSESIRTWEAADGAPLSLPALLADAAAWQDPVAVFDANDPRLSAPGDMPARIAEVLRDAGHDAPETRAAFARTIIESIAHAFAEAVHTAGRLSNRKIDVVHVVGGGALNRLLCQATADRTGVPVVAGPVEATAIGNVLVQARTLGWFGENASLETLRETVARSFPTERYTPRV